MTICRSHAVLYTHALLHTSQMKELLGILIIKCSITQKVPCRERVCWEVVMITIFLLQRSLSSS